MNIKDVHPHYASHSADWQMLHDIVEKGERTIKEKKERYLPFPVSLPLAETLTDDFIRQYEIYLHGAYFVNFTQEAVDDLVNCVFSRDIIHDDLPQQLEYVDVSKIAKPLLKMTGTYGHAFALVDYPELQKAATLKEQEELNIRAYVTLYKPFDVINWTTERQGGVDVLNRVVIKESFIEDNEEKTRYRELSIIDRVYTIKLYDDDGKLIVDPKTQKPFIQPTASGKKIAKIPGLFVGVNSNNRDIDQSPVLSIANTNLTHYQTTAELQHVIVYQGHPMLAITGAPNGFIKEMKENDIKINVGASSALVVEGETATAYVLEIKGKVTHYDHLEVLKESMIEQGARIKTSEKSGVESAESLRIRASSSNSTLASMAIQVENAIVDILGFMADFMGTELGKDFKVNLNKQFIIEQPDPRLIEVLSSLHNQGKIPFRILGDYLSEVRLVNIDEDIEALYQEAQAEVPDIQLDATI